MKKIGLLLVLLAALPLAVHTQTNIKNGGAANPTVYNQYWGGVDSSGITRPMIGMSSNGVTVDPDAQGTRVGGALTVAGAFVVSGTQTFTGDLELKANLIFEGSTADANELTVTAADPTSDTTLTLADASGTVFLSTLSTNAPNVANSVWGASNALSFEGLTADAFEASFTPADVMADRTLTIADASGTLFLSTLSTNAPDAANSIWGASNALSFEGATADAFETSFAPADPTADRTYTLADASGTVFLSTLATNAPDVANSVWGASNALVFEGLTANGFELSVVPADITADRTLTVADADGTVFISTLATNAPDVANSLWGVSNGLNFEGVTADGFELTVAPADVTADRTATIPDATFTVGTISATFVDGVTGSATDRVFFVATRGWIVTSCSNVFSVAAGGTSKLQVVKDTSTNAPGAGTDLLTNNTNAGFDLNATANTVQVGTLAASAATLTLAAGDRLAVDYADAIQSTAGNTVSCTLAPIN